MELDHEALIGMLTRLELTAIRDQLDNLLDEASRRELTLREAVGFLCEREIARQDERSIEMAIKIAQFTTVPELDGLDFAARKEARRAGKGCVSTFMSRWSPYHYNKTNIK